MTSEKHINISLGKLAGIAPWQPHLPKLIPRKTFCADTQKSSAENLLRSYVLHMVLAKGFEPLTPSM